MAKKSNTLSAQGGASPAYNSSGFVTLSESKKSPSQHSVVASYDGLSSTVGTYGGRDRYKDYDSHTSVRNEFTRSDYEFFRPNETIPQNPIEIISLCRNAYRRVGIIRNVMDLMADFGCQGARLVHPNPTIQKFYRGWWKKVGGPRVCERFLNLLYREGVAIAKRTMGRLPMSGDAHFKAFGDNTKLQPDTEYEKPTKTGSRVIPLRYNFLNPLTVKVLGEDVAQFVGKVGYALKVSYKLKMAITNPRSSIEKKLVEMIPDEIRQAIIRGDTEIPLDPDKVRAFFYKKDDWNSWADPMTYAIMDDIFLLEKMKLADLAALDGAISQIRIWKLGHLNDTHPEMSIFPTEPAVERLSEIILSNPGGGAFDIIWGPELTVEEYKTNVHQFLGEGKYKPVWNSIYAGLGVPPTLTGASTASGMTNNYISLKTLIQRLEYGREILTSFWEEELELVRQAMSFRKAAKLVFDNMVLSDEAAEKALLIQLIDRDVLSIETLIERFGELPEVEQLRLQREEKERKKNKMKPKASPWHTPEKVYEFMKMALQRGYIAPEQTGMTEEFPEEFLDMETPFEQQLNLKKDSGGKSGPTSTEKKSGVPSQGRPKNSKDSAPRDERTPKPLGASTAAYFTAMMWTRDAQRSIANIVNPVFLQHVGKKTMRELSTEQVKQLENTKFSVLCNMQPYSDVTDVNVYGILASAQPAPDKYTDMYDRLHAKIAAMKDRGEISIEDIRMMQATTYAALNCDESLIYNKE